MFRVVRGMDNDSIYGMGIQMLVIYPQIWINEVSFKGNTESGTCSN